VLRKALVLFILMQVSLAHAETFKCSKAGGASYYSDTPCGTDKTVRVEKTLVTSANGQISQKLLGKMRDLCKESLKDWIPYSDPRNFTYREGSRLIGKNVVMKSAKGSPQPAIRFNLEATSRSSSNRYGGTETTYYCYVTPSDMPSVIGIYTQLME
jgi:hypothetical protein